MKTLTQSDNILNIISIILLILNFIKKKKKLKDNIKRGDVSELRGLSRVLDLTKRV
jgi:hypothetical protein